MAVPRTLSGSTSGSITQTTGPQVAAKETMKLARQRNVTIAAGLPGEFGLAKTSVDDTQNRRDSATMPASPATSIGLRPTRSTIRMATIVMRTFSDADRQVG